jgi:hypothetical protein
VLHRQTDEALDFLEVSDWDELHIQPSTVSQRVRTQTIEAPDFQ